MTERLIRIRSLLQENKKVYVADLSRTFQVSKVTIRHDLALLEQEHFARRIHGGAILLRSSENTGTAPERSQTDPVLTRIALKAKDFILEGDTIFLGPGKTCCYLAAQLGSFSDLCVFTNNITALPHLVENGVRVYLMGGEIGRGYENHLQTNLSDLKIPEDQLYTMKGFFSVDGIDLKAGLTVPDAATANLLTRFREYSRDWYLMTDHSKYDRISLYPAGHLEAIDHLVTDSVPQKYGSFFQRIGTQIHPA